MSTAKEFIDELELEPHPEGGYYREIYRNPNTIQIVGGGGTRNLATSIYFLLDRDQKSYFHELKSDELWYFHAGSAVVIHVFDQGMYHRWQLGLEIADGESPQVLLPKGSIFAAEVKDQTSYTLMGCMVNPGFDFKDFRLSDRTELTEQFPDLQKLIEQFTLE